jgi:ArsR family metal-binding transcriptional regulator
MLLKKYRLEIFRPECNASFQSLHCHMHLDEDIGCVIPYLNGTLGGSAFTTSPPSVMFKIHGRLIAVHATKISVNAIKDTPEAEKIAAWLQREINETWEKRETLTPKYQAEKEPQFIEILKLLPKTNCRECGQPTCMVFATLVIQGIKGANDCPAMTFDKRRFLERYLCGFELSQ